MSEQVSRGGHFGWNKRHPIICLSLVFLLLACAIVLLVDRVAVQRLQRQIAEIKARHEPVSAADLRDIESPIPEEENLALALFVADRPHSKFGGAMAVRVNTGHPPACSHPITNPFSNGPRPGDSALSAGRR